jgi:hypothetical protein
MAPTRRRLGTKALVVAAGLAAAGVVVAGGRGDASRSQAPPTTSPAAAQVEAEAEAMVDAGASPNDPKVEMLEQDAEALEDAAETPPRPEPGVDLAAKADAGQQASTPSEARALTEEMRSDQPAVTGGVMCEPIPQLLSAEEVAGARCYSIPQPDGTSRYVAVTPDGRVLIVEFAPGGEVRRLPESRLPAGAQTATAQLAPDPAGDLSVRPPDAAPATVDLG